MNTLEASREVEACALAKITIDNPNSKQRQKGLQISDMSQRHFCPARLETYSTFEAPAINSTTQKVLQ